MPAFRCSMCTENWPTHPAYLHCPECGEKVSYISRVPAMPMPEAARRRNHAEFERFYTLRRT